jgi:hypothetical protein
MLPKFSTKFEIPAVQTVQPQIWTAKQLIYLLLLARGVEVFFGSSSQLLLEEEAA